MKAVDLLNRVAARLALIRTADGYATDAGARLYRVIVGMPLPESLTLPALFLRIESAEVTAINRIRSADTVGTLTLVVEGAVAVVGQTAPDTALLALLGDIRASLLAEDAFAGLLNGIDPIRISSASFRLPEGGNALATVIQPLTLTFSERYSID